MKNPTCPSCGFVFGFLSSLKCWNLHRITCPKCRRSLQARHATALVIASGIGGLAIAAVAIYFEATGRWQTLDSLRYFAVVLIVLLLPSALLWSRVQLIPRGDV